MTPSFLETNQMRPCQSGSADVMRWLSVSTFERS